MKSLITMCSITLILLAAAPATATLYTVELGYEEGPANSYSVDGGAYSAITDTSIITISDWGQAESGDPEGTPMHNPGGYGGIGEGECRMVLGNDDSGDTNMYAIIYFPEDVVQVTIEHLDGSVGDSFDVHVDNVYWDSYDAAGGSETWETTTFSGTAGSVLMITITDPETSWASTWGQLGIDWVEADTVPEPATLALLGLGGLVLRKRR